MKTYILQTSDGLCLSRDLDWIADITGNNLFKAEHQDIALNQLIKLHAKDINPRATVVSCEFDSAGQLIKADQHSATTQ